MKAQLIARTEFTPPADMSWETDAEGGQALAEFAGRSCYRSWSKPNPATATNAGYLRHILEVKHGSVLEHASVTFYITGVSRSLTHELVRHRHLQFSQLSQRFVSGRDAVMVEPAVIAEDPELHKKFVAATRTSLTAYAELLTALETRFEPLTKVDLSCPACGQAMGYQAFSGGREGYCVTCEDAFPVHAPLSRTDARKQARQAARSVLPNATETRIVVTGNYRAWRHVIALRATAAADVEIRALVVEVLRQLQVIAPNVFGDFVITTLDDGTEVASSRFAEEG